jgi:hypothetical protein
LKAFAEQGVLSEDGNRAVSSDRPVHSATSSGPAPPVDVPVTAYVSGARLRFRSLSRAISAAEEVEECASWSGGYDGPRDGKGDVCDAEGGSLGGTSWPDHFKAIHELSKAG